jgi:YidC/Oxa1 family membrane protein insertase
VQTADTAPASVARPRNYGLLAPIARPLEWTLREVETRLTHSWGGAIIVTTFLINALLLPFKISGARNAAKMKRLQPEIDAVHARHQPKDPRHSREIAAVYRAHGTSPLTACLTALAPFAVLAAFYSVLTGIACLRGATWLWIADLSRPEQLPLRILPVAMIATQLWLGRITPAADPRVSRLTAWMPLAFGIALYGQPAALMLYWVTSNLLQLAQQYWLTRRYAGSELTR